MENGESKIFYSKNKVYYGDTCERYKRTRTCKESKLNGPSDFKYDSCFISKEGICNVSDSEGNNIIMSNKTNRTFFSKSLIDFNDYCKNYSKNRFCINGILNGDKNYSFLYCKKKTAKSCTISGLKLKHGEGKIFYSKAVANGTQSCGFYSQNRQCSDGLMTGDNEYNKLSCTDSNS
jgi:hypothetical protein